MRKYIILFFLVLPFLFACNWGGAPNGIIKQNEMIALLTELHLADGSLANLSQAPDTLYKYGTGKYLAIFKKFNTDSAQFRKSYKYYTTQPVRMQTIYDQVLKSLQAKSDSVTALLAKQNTSEANKRPFLPAAAPGKMAPPGVGAMQTQASANFRLQHNLNTGNSTSLAKLKARRDSLRKKHLKSKHALSKK